MYEYLQGSARNLDARLFAYADICSGRAVFWTPLQWDWQDREFSYVFDIPGLELLLL
jgi:hypothetical protein